MPAGKNKKKSMFCAVPMTVLTAADASAWASQASLEAACPPKETAVCAALCGVGGKGVWGKGSWGGTDMLDYEKPNRGKCREKGGPETAVH